MQPTPFACLRRLLPPPSQALGLLLLHPAQRTVCRAAVWLRRRPTGTRCSRAHPGCRCAAASSAAFFPLRLGLTCHAQVFLCGDSREDGDTQTFRFELDQTISPKKPGWLLCARCAAAPSLDCVPKRSTRPLFVLPPVVSGGGDMAGAVHQHLEPFTLSPKPRTPQPHPPNPNLKHQTPCSALQIDQSMLRVTLGDDTWALTRSCVTKGGRIDMICARASAGDASAPVMVAHVDVDQEGAHARRIVLAFASPTAPPPPCFRRIDRVWHRD